MVKNSLELLRSRVDDVCRSQGRSSDEIELVLVTKQVQNEQILEAYEAGYRDFGENRVQDLVAKRDVLPKDIRWHLIGSLQTNKVKYVLGSVVLIHSCDRLELAGEIQKQGEKKNKMADILIQVNTSAELTKHGFQVDEVDRAVSEIESMSHIRIRGMMTIGPLTDDAASIKEAFSKLRQLNEQFKQKHPKHDWKYLSMGMSSDFECAIREGSNMLRIGSFVFGQRS